MLWWKHLDLEHAYQFTKVKTYGHDDLADPIRKAKDSKEALKLAREVHENDTWNIVQVNVMTFDKREREVMTGILKCPDQVKRLYFRKRKNVKITYTKHLH